MPGKLGDEPLPCGEDWVEWGGESIWAEGFMGGGAVRRMLITGHRG